MSLERTSGEIAASEEVAAPKLKARQSWQRLWLRIQTITPSGLVRLALVLTAIGLLLWFLLGSLSTLIPFVIGSILAYITLPLVNALDTVMPRIFASLLVILLELAIIVLFFVLLIPAVINEVNTAIQNLPSTQQIRDFLVQLQQQFRTLPTPLRDFITGGLKQASVDARNNFVAYVGQLLNFGLNTILTLLSSLTFGIALLVIPTWLFSILNEQKRARRVLDRALPNWMRPDFWAVIRLIDRTLSVYLRELVVLSILVGITTFGALSLLQRLGVQGVSYRILLAAFAGFADLIPAIGPFIGAIPALIVGALHSWDTALAILLAYIGVQLVRNWFLAPLFSGKSITLHPAILVVVLTIASRFGLFWLFLAAPIAVIVRDLFVYTYGRFGDPARPAGLLPGQKLPVVRRSRGRPRGTPPAQFTQSNQNAIVSDGNQEATSENPGPMS